MNIIILVGPTGSGKSTTAKDLENQHGYVRISQDDDGKIGHMIKFQEALKDKKDIVVDRLNFVKEQRDRYLIPAKELGYNTHIAVLHENRDECIKRCIKRIGSHPTIKSEESALTAIDMFFRKYEKPTASESDTLEFIYPTPTVPVSIIWCDIDNTIADTSHREYHLKNGGKDKWKKFFDDMDKDELNVWCKKILNNMRSGHIIAMCSGRPNNYRDKTKKWLRDHYVLFDYLFMRPEGDMRSDTVVKEIILDFEIKTRGTVLFAIDDRACVIQMLRKNNILVLDCAGEKGNF